MIIDNIFQRQIEEALLDAFPGYGPLSRMVTLSMGENLAAIAETENLVMIIHYLTRWAINQNRIVELIDGAHEDNPGNGALTKVWKKIHRKPGAYPEFVNRQHELSVLSFNTLRMSSIYTFVYAPAGYGKTYLLKRLQKKAAASPKVKSEWNICYIDFRKGDSPQYFMACLAQNCGMRLSPMDINGVLNHILTVMAARNQNGRTHVLFILDSMDSTSLATREWLYDLFNRLYLRTEANNQASPFCIRFILAGRDLNEIWDKGLSTCNPRPPAPRRIKLTRFDALPIHELIFKRQKVMHLQLPSADIAKMAEEIEYISGGHPRIIQRMVKHLEEGAFTLGPISTFFDENRVTMVQRFTAPVAAELLYGLDPNIQLAMHALSIFRLVTGDTIHELKINQKLPETTHIIDTLRELQKVQLLSAPQNQTEPFYRGDLIHRVLSTRIQFEDPDCFNRLNSIALSMYRKWIYNGLGSESKAIPALSLVSLVEYLYHAHKQTVTPMAEIADEFSKILQALNICIDPSDDYWSAILNGIRQDTELNYLIRTEPNHTFAWLLKQDS